METKNDRLWLELIESKDFDQLSNSEKAFVLGQSTEDNFRLERSVLIESKMVYAEVEPQPLILEGEKKGLIIPVYQTILAVAAAFVLGLLLFRSNETTTVIQKSQALAVADTVYVEKLITDTIIQTKTEYIRLATTKSVYKEVQCPESIESSVLSNQSSFKTDLSSTVLINKGTSAANDETLVLMESWVSPN